MSVLLLDIFKKHKKIIVILLALAAAAPAALIIVCYFIIEPYKKLVIDPGAKHSDIGIVLGSGISKDGKPYQELAARLDVAAIALKDGTVNKLILSGDNRYVNYNEPDAMKKYLIENKNVAADKLQPDYAGRSTYESCERAAKVFSVKKAIIFSAGSHLPRAIYLCRHFGIEAYGISSNVEANNSWRREPLARVKAVYNLYFIGEPTALGASQ